MLVLHHSKNKKDVDRRLWYIIGLWKENFKSLPELENQVENMTEKEALDILVQNVAESKKQFAQGRYYTIEESYALLKDTPHR